MPKPTSNRVAEVGSKPEASKGFRTVVYSECLTRDGSDIACYKLDPKRNLASPTEAQDVLRIMDDRPYARNATTRSRHGLGKTRFGGFFLRA
ncbi:hypothetical protein EMIT0P43_160051 [Pseudomonas jessenii]